VIEIQLPLLVAIQLQLEAVVTVKLPAYPAEGTLEFEAGFKVTEQGGGGGGVPGSWLMPITWLPAMMVAVRREPVFASTVKLAVPFPLPDKVPESVIHDAVV
jgi:hypothetical protein